MKAETVYINVHKHRNETLERNEFIENLLLNKLAHRIAKSVKKSGVIRCLKTASYSIIINP